MPSNNQPDRAISALRPESTPLDSRMVRQLVERSALYRFFDMQNRSEGWSAAYLQMPLGRYARLAELDLRSDREWISAALRTLAQANDDESDVAQIGARLLTQLAGWFLRIEEERLAFSAWPHERPFVVGLEKLIVTRLGRPWHRLRKCRDEMARRWPALSPAHSIPLWPTPAAPCWGEYETVSPFHAAKNRDALNRELNAVVSALFSAWDLVIVEAQRLFKERFATSG